MDPRTLRSRPSALPAPPAADAGGAAQGAEILEELPGPAGVVLWEVLRDVMLWLGTRPGRRGEIALPGALRRRRADVEAAGLDGGAGAPLLALAALRESPHGVDRPRLPSACASVAAWAEERGAPATRLAFTELAALLDPADAGLALETAKLARERADYARAEGWFRHAIRQARRAKEWETYVWAFVGLGVLYMRVGNYPAANAVMGRALRMARHHRRREMEGVVRHHLFGLSTERGDLREAYEHAQAAGIAYGSNHPRLPGLVHDVARFWIHQGSFARAIPLFRAVLPHFPEPSGQVIVVANLAWAAAGATFREEYEQARHTAIDLLTRGPKHRRVAEAYTVLGYADLSIGEWGRAEEMARRALAAARPASEPEIQAIAENQLERARMHRTYPESPIPEETPVLARRADRIANDLLESLTEGRVLPGEFRDG